MWSSAMVLAPMLRGLFGLDANVPDRTLKVTPHLPADWDSAELLNVPFGKSLLSFQYSRKGGSMVVQAHSSTPEVICLVSKDANTGPCKDAPATVHTVSLPLPAVELSIPTDAPSQGAATRQLKVLNEEYTDRQATFSLSSPAKSTYDLFVRFNKSNVTVTGAVYANGHLHVEFPEGAGHQTRTVTFHW